MPLWGCGGGGGAETPLPPPPAPAATVAGLYFGTTAVAGGTFDALILNNGRIYGMLGAGGGLSTVFFGRGTPTATGFTSTAGATLQTASGNPTVPGAVTLTGVPKGAVSGALTGVGVSATFNANYRATFEATPAQASLVGTYLGNSSGLGRVINLTLTIDAAGAASGTSSDGCTHTGTVTPNASANVYDVSVTFGAGCPKRGRFSGHALWQEAAGANPATLTLLASTDDFAEAWIFFGGKL